MADTVFRARLHMLRKSRNLTQSQMAAKLGVSRPGYTCYELGNSLPTVATLCKIADFFNVSLDYLVGRTEDPSIDAADTERAKQELCLLEKFRRLPPEKRAKLCDMVDLFTD